MSRWNFESMSSLSLSPTKHDEDNDYYGSGGELLHYRERSRFSWSYFTFLYIFLQPRLLFMTGKNLCAKHASTARLRDFSAWGPCWQGCITAGRVLMPPTESTFTSNQCLGVTDACKWHSRQWLHTSYTFLCEMSGRRRRRRRRRRDKFHKLNNFLTTARKNLHLYCVMICSSRRTSGEMIDSAC